jgi:hypothetical protein
MLRLWDAAMLQLRTEFELRNVVRLSYVPMAKSASQTVSVMCSVVAVHPRSGVNTSPADVTLSMAVRSLAAHGPHEPSISFPVEIHYLDE